MVRTPQLGSNFWLLKAYLEEEVLEPVPHWHTVLSIPKRLRIFFKYDRGLNHLLFAAAWKAIQEMFAAVLPQGVPGLGFDVSSTRLSSPKSAERCCVCRPPGNP